MAGDGRQGPSQHPQRKERTQRTEREKALEELFASYVDRLNRG